MCRMHFGKRECYAAFRIRLLRWMGLPYFVTLTLRPSFARHDDSNSHSNISPSINQVEPFPYPGRLCYPRMNHSGEALAFQNSTYDVLGAWDVPDFQRRLRSIHVRIPASNLDVWREFVRLCACQRNANRPRCCFFPCTQT
jgi:hypothetical protein